MPKLVNITKKWGNKSIFDNFCYEFEKNKITAVIGRSGIGKTTLLNILAGLISFQGSILPKEDSISYVFQSARLVPFMTVEENLKYVLKSVYKDKAILNEAIDRYLALTDLKDKKYSIAENLSGGEKQRVSLARAFIFPHKLLLMDEPFNSLDLGLKLRIANLFKSLIQNEPTTCIMVTHSVDEALYLADNILLLYNGGFQSFKNYETERKFGYEKDNSLRQQLYSLLLKE